MFFYASAFNQDLGWCLHSSVDMTSAFSGTMCAEAAPHASARRHARGRGPVRGSPLPDARTDAGPLDLARADGDARPSGGAFLNSNAAAHGVPHALTRCKVCTQQVFEGQCDEGTKEATPKWDAWDCVAEGVPAALPTRTTAASPSSTGGPTRPARPSPSF